MTLDIDEAERLMILASAVYIARKNLDELRVLNKTASPDLAKNLREEMVVATRLAGKVA